MQIGITKRQFNKNLKDVMKKRGVSNTQIARCVGRRSVSWASHVINFHIMPSEYERMQIAVFLETPEEYLFPPEYEEIYKHLKGVVNDIDLWVTPKMLYSEPSLLLSDNNMEIHKSNEQTIDLCLGVLKDREQTVLCLRNGLRGEAPQTLEEVAKVLGVTRERVRQMEAKAHEKIRQAGYAKDLVACG